MSYKDVLAVVAIVVTFVAFVPYIRSIQAGTTKPHVFSWIVWGSVTIIVFLAQLADKGGAGAWPTGVSGLITIYVAFVAYKKHADSIITKSDWCFFFIALSSIPLWYITSDPMWAVIVLTTIDLIGFIPTFRKTYANPHEEQLGFYSIISLRNMIAIVALEHYSLTTVLFPGLTGLACVLFIIMVRYRQRQLREL